MLLKTKTIERLKKKYGNWALVTGATSGIGKELALNLARAGFNLVITGRRKPVLNELATKIFDEYNTQAIPVPGDLSNNNDLKELMNETSHLALGIIILNAGYGTSGQFIDADIATESNMLELNCMATLKLSYHYANQLRSSKKKGAIVLLSSIVAFQGVPNAANYAATKAYVQSLGEALSKELKPHGIAILTASPGPVQSGFASRANMKMNSPLKPEAIAIPIISAIGKRNIIYPGSLTKLLFYSLSMLPRWGKTMVMGKVMAGFTKHH